jgi:hypothetical protein
VPVLVRSTDCRSSSASTAVSAGNPHRCTSAAIQSGLPLILAWQGVGLAVDSEQLELVTVSDTEDADAKKGAP